MDDQVGVRASVRAISEEMCDLGEAEGRVAWRWMSYGLARLLYARSTDARRAGHRGPSPHQGFDPTIVVILATAALGRAQRRTGAPHPYLQLAASGQGCDGLKRRGSSDHGHMPANAASFRRFRLWHSPCG